LSLFKNTIHHTGDKIEFNTVDFVESRLLPKPATNRQQSRLLPYTFNFVVDTVDFVTSVYGAKATRLTLSTFNKVDRVEFNFVDSVYWALCATASCKSALIPASQPPARQSANTARPRARDRVLRDMPVYVLHQLSPGTHSSLHTKQAQAE